MPAVKRSKSISGTKESLKDIIDAVAAKEDALRPRAEVRKEPAAEEFQVKTTAKDKAIEYAQLTEKPLKPFTSGFVKGLGQGLGLMSGLVLIGMISASLIGWLLTLPYFGDYLYNILYLFRALASAKF